MAAQAGADGILDDVPANGDQLVLVLDRATPEALAEQVTPAAVAGVEGLGIAPVESLEAGGELRDRCLDHQVVVIRHQAERVEAPVVSAHDDVEEAEEELAVLGIAVDRNLSGPTRGHVEVAVGEDVSR